MANPSSSGASAKRQHYVPRFYLRRFANPKGQVSVFDRQMARSYTTSVENVAVEAGFYDAFTENGERLTLAEETLSKVEGEARHVIEALARSTKGGLGPDQEQRETLALFLALQTTRTREAWDAEAEISDLYMRLQLDLSLTGATRERYAEEMEEMLSRTPAEDEIDALRALVDRIETIRFGPSAGHQIQHMFQVALDIAPILTVRPWTLLYTDKRAFVTCDRPVVLWRPRTSQDSHYGIGVASADRIFVPLGPRHMLRMDHGTDAAWSMRSVSGAETKDINRTVSHWAYRYIFHSPKHRPLEGESISPEGPVLHINGIPVRPGSNTWNALRKNFQKGTTLPVIHFGYGVDRSRKK